jgi:hypothetical protein
MRDKIVKTFCESTIFEAPKKKLEDSYDAISPDIVASAKRVRNPHVDSFLKLFANKYPKVKARAAISTKPGFILPDGSFKAVDGHEVYAERNGFSDSISLLKKTQWVRWSPDTESITFAGPMSEMQLAIFKLIADVYDEFEESGSTLTLEYVNPEGKFTATELEIPASMSDRKSEYYDIKIDSIQKGSK